MLVMPPQSSLSWPWWPCQDVTCWGLAPGETEAAAGEEPGLWELPAPSAHPPGSLASYN